MGFKTKRIRKRPPLHPFRKCKRAYVWVRENIDFYPKHRSYILGAILVVLAALVVFKVMFAAYGWVRRFEVEDLLFAAGSDLKQDENGYTNLVLLGDGGSVRDGADLVDTIMVVSLDTQKKAVTLFSIPRDYYVDSQYRSRINELYRNHKNLLGDQRAFELFQEVTGKITNLTVHYYLRTDFQAFVEAVDALEGIEVDVPVAIDDPYYPNETDDGYNPFKMEAGLQHMDGETALKYVRSRKTTSDFDRAARQHLVLAAIKEKALEKGVLTNSKIIKKLYGTVRDHVNTDLDLREMITLARFAKDFDRGRLVSKVLHDDPGQDGGFLYTPEREFFEGKFVLVPYGENLDLIHRYAELIFNKREAVYSPLKVEVLNATRVPGIAGKTVAILTRFGFEVVNADNLYDAAGERVFSDTSVIRYYGWQEGKNGQVIPKHPVFLEALQDFVKAEAVAGDPSLAGTADVTIILGADYDVFLVN